ncbi:MAG TPA: hypothetical protein VHW47_03665, partial [Acidimicrobiales bacterium]|nr:hypothetical protein [Acidimicrobiales bacterium]
AHCRGSGWPRSWTPEVPSALTTVTELATGLGMLGDPTVDEAIDRRPAEMVSVAPETWTALRQLRDGGALDPKFDSAFANGSAFLRAADALRGRRPVVVEWKGSHRAPGDEVAPIDLRVDHVYLVSCKYDSKILLNPSPNHLVDDLLTGRHGRRSGDWYAAVAPAEHDALYRLVRDRVDPAGLPARADDLRTDDRRHLAVALKPGWPDGGDDAYAALAAAVSGATAARWSANLSSTGQREAMLWRLLRMGSAPYFVLGGFGGSPLRLRIATPWDWRQRFRLASFAVEAQLRGQPQVGWQAEVKDLHTGETRQVAGHVEVRWSHGKFSGPPEAKVYLDTPHHDVPGYFPLA